MSQQGRKRKSNVNGKEEIFCPTSALKLIVSKAASENSPDGHWVHWTPNKCLDQINTLGISFEEYIYLNKKTCLLRCAPVDDENCKICGSEVYFIQYSDYKIHLSHFTRTPRTLFTTKNW